MIVSKAKEKVCPFITDNQGFHEGVPTKCICSDCMAWKYTKTTSGNKFEMIVQKQNDGTSIQQRRYIELEEEDKEGYCQRLTML